MAAFKKVSRETKRQPHPVCPEAQAYEQLKAGFRRAGLTPAEYARACRRAARKAGL